MTEVEKAAAMYVEAAFQATKRDQPSYAGIVEKAFILGAAWQYTQDQRLARAAWKVMNYWNILKHPELMEAMGDLSMALQDFDSRQSKQERTDE